MTKLLVSVRDAAEALVAFEAGADLIDVKEPLRGPLGAADPEVIAEVARRLDGRAPLSAALGELVQWDPRHGRGLPAGLAFAKLGLAGCASQADWPDRWAKAISGLPPAVAPVAVVYADWRVAQAPHPQQVLDAGARVGCRALLVDTFDKSSGGLLHHVSLDSLGRLIAAANRMGWLTVLAGSLSPTTLPRVLPLEPDYVAVRGAACRPDRNGAVCADCVHNLAHLLKQGKSYRFPSNA